MPFYAYFISKIKTHMHEYTCNSGKAAGKMETLIGLAAFSINKHSVFGKPSGSPQVTVLRRSFDLMVLGH